ncbi:Zinc finger BED domain-containing protein RICESLEEPER 2 [Glycine soja]
MSIVTPKRKETIEETTKQLRISCTKILVFDCPTRWNSTYKMLEIAISYEVMFTRLKQQETQYTSLWLKVFNVVTKIFFATKQPTTNMYFSMICEIKLAISQWVTSPNELIHKMAKRMLTKFDKY